MNDFPIRPGRPEDHESCLGIARGLPEYFNRQGLADIARDLQRHRLFVAEDHGVPAGFLLLDFKNPDVSEITWMAVHPDRRGRGVGTALVDAAVRSAAGAGTALLSVKTLAPTVEYAPYEATRAFYAARGFAAVEIIDPYPPWGEGNPCLISVRVVAASTAGEPYHKE